MELDRRQSLQDDCRSFGSNIYPSSQSRKISIGITLDSLGKRRTGALEKDESVLPNVERMNSKKEESLEGKLKGKAVAEAIEGKQTDVPEKVTSPWVTTKSFYRKPSNPNTFVFGKETPNLPAAKGGLNNFSSAQDTAVTHSVFESQTLVLHSGEEKQKKFRGLTYKRKGSKDGSSQKSEEVALVATAPQVPAPDKVATGNKREDRNSETLRVKLWEILGTVSSPKSQPSNSQAQQLGTNNLKPEKTYHQKVDAVHKPLQNSDSIETDSENPNPTTKRPVTRSVTRIRANRKVQSLKKRTDPSSSYRNQVQEKNTFSFEEGLLGKKEVPVSHSSSLSLRNKGSRKTSGAVSCQNHFRKNSIADEFQGGNCRSGILPPAEKASSLGDRMGTFLGCLPQSKGECFEQRNRNQGHSNQSLRKDSTCSAENQSPRKDSSYSARNQSPRKDSTYSAGKNTMEQKGVSSNEALPDNEDREDAFGQPSLKYFLDQQDELQSPTFKVNTPMLSPSPSLTPQTDQIEKKVNSPDPADREFTLGNVYSFRNLKTAKVVSPSPAAPNAKAESSDDDVELKDSSPRKSSPLKERENVDDGLSESLSDSEDSIGSEEDHTEREALFSEPATSKRSNLTHNPSKRLRNLEGKSVRRFSPILPSTKGIAEDDWDPELSGPTQENDLERVFTLLALALEHFKNKMQTATRKKSSDILTSVSEEIHLQLQSVALQIRTDVGELTGSCKSKRKRLEMRFQEQQEKLKLIQDKFKQDIHQHLQDCKSTVDEFEMHQVELKGTIKKQKASHQKLFMDLDEAVETKLNDAQRRIAAIHKLARQKMLQMQQVIAGCLNEGVLS